MNVNSGKDPMLEAFDCPDPSVKTPRRGVTTTPLQALSLMNSSFVQRQAAHLAARVRCEGSASGRERHRTGLSLLFRPRPLPVELEQAEEAASAAGLDTVCWALLNATEFLYVR